MTTKTEETVLTLQQQGLETAMRMAQLSIEGSQRLVQLQLELARELIEDGVEGAKAFGETRSPQEALELRARHAQRTAEHLLGRCNEIVRVSAEIQGEFGRLVSERFVSGSQEAVSAMQKAWSGLPFGGASGEAMQNTFEAARKTFEQLSRASGEAFAAASPPPARKR
ncbi:MAG: phasin family protein [Candidatus Dactylopiibacterium sp.]|nr:phasin family protein [Candidatus Dactylopiibacterium sp.]